MLCWRMFFGTEKSNRIHSTCVLHDIINSINMCLIELSEYTKFPFFSLLVTNPVCAGAEGGERWPGLGAGLQEARHPGDWRVKGGDSHNIRWLNRLCPPDTLTVVHLHRGLWTCIGLSIRYWLMVHLCARSCPTCWPTPTPASTLSSTRKCLAISASDSLR